MSQNQGGFLPSSLITMMARTDRSQSKVTEKDFERMFREVDAGDKTLTSKDRAYLNSFKKEKLNGRSRREFE